MKPQARREGEQGQAVVLVALLMSVLLLAVGLAIDSGQLFVARRTAQEAADAAAWAGAVALHLGGTTQDAKNAAVTDATRNGFTADASTTVTANAPPLSGPHAADSQYIEVIITRSVRTSLMPQGSLTAIKVRGVAGTVPVSTGYALMTLEPTKKHSFEITGNGNVTVTGASVYVNSNDNEAAKRSGNGTLTVAAPAGAYVVGGQNGFTNPWTTGVTPVPDPFAGYPKPSTVGLTNYGKVKVNGGTTTLQPGIYDELSVKGNANVTFAPGIYILRGGMDLGPDTDSGAGNISGTGVTFFNAGKNFPTKSSDCKKISITHDGAFNVTAPTSGQYKGMLIYQDADCKGFDISIKGNGGVTTPSGTIYAPSAKVKVEGNGDLNLAGQLIAETVEVSGNGNLVVTFDAGTTAQAILPALAE